MASVVLAEKGVETQNDTTTSDTSSEILRDSATHKVEHPNQLHVLPPLSSKHKWTILALLITSYFIDVVSSSAFFVFTGVISRDLDIPFEQQSWIITSYTVTFASFLLFWGRVSDLFSAVVVFKYGLLAFGILNIILSFLTDQYSFFVFRALAGVAGSSLVPSAYRLIASTFPENERSRAYTLYGTTGSIANVTGTIIAGVIALITDEGQMRNWRWFFRICSFLALPAAAASFIAIPDRQVHIKVEGRMKRLDPIGVSTMLTAILLLILGLTLGASYGFGTPHFIVPVILFAILFPCFFLWERRLDDDHAILPPSLWRVPNFTMFLVFALYPLGWWGSNFIPFIELFNQVNGESMIVAAVRTLPEGVAAASVSVVLILFPGVTSRLRISLPVALLLAIGATVLWTQAPGVVEVDYWKYIFPGMVFGSAGMQVVLIATIVGVMAAVPPEKAGVVGAALQTSMHSSTVVALAIQAGLFTVQEGGLENYANVQASFYFEIGWGLAWIVLFLAWYRPVKGVNETEKQSDGSVHV